MKHPFNYLSLAALPALASLLYFPTGERDYLCFLGFLVFLRYLWVNPDELFLLSVRKAATGAFLLQFALIWPCLFLFHFLAPQANPMPPVSSSSVCTTVGWSGERREDWNEPENTHPGIAGP